MRLFYGLFIFFLNLLRISNGFFINPTRSSAGVEDVLRTPDLLSGNRRSQLLAHAAPNKLPASSSSIKHFPHSTITSKINPGRMSLGGASAPAVTRPEDTSPLRVPDLKHVVLLKPYYYKLVVYTNTVTVQQEAVGKSDGVTMAMTLAHAGAS
ncbi:hypothetical protein PGTUg99_031762 [Puccinia graminis f. sp. tritici]|uniref:Uncharacterized protein n=1 Tax=Puccinia graminis f. sp. tritici TaxID=56615 RepID=A0A5B0Q9Q5_PUCGR|nr:hypothetical protein PGTUg99_031762 [Puccinia graminis f. sp. tritici]